MVTLVGVGDFEAHSQVVVTPEKDTAYLLEAHWEGDPVTQQIDVQVEPPVAVPVEPPPVKLEHAEAQVDPPESQSQPEPSRPWRGSRAAGWFVAILVGVTLGYVYVHLTEPGEPRIERFSADPACLVRGEQLTLRWKVHGTASVDLIKEENGKPTSKRRFDGNVTEYRPDPPPQATATYMLQAGGAESSAAPYQKLLVKVVSPEEILRGGCSTSSVASPGK